MWAFIYSQTGKHVLVKWLHTYSFLIFCFKLQINISLNLVTVKCGCSPGFLLGSLSVFAQSICQQEWDSTVGIWRQISTTPSREISQNIDSFLLRHCKTKKDYRVHLSPVPWKTRLDSIAYGLNKRTTSKTSNFSLQVVSDEQSVRASDSLFQWSTKNMPLVPN